jgi:uncharacterized protein YndB with AHSA1/START domain
MTDANKSDRSGTRGYAHLVEVKAPPGRVWRALTDPALIRIWSGAEAEIVPRKGGVFRLGRRGAGCREAHIDVFDPNRRLRLIYLGGDDFPPSNSAVVDDFLLDSRRTDGMSSVRLLGSGIPEAAAWDQTYAKFRMGWERWLGRIKMTLENPPNPHKARLKRASSQSSGDSPLADFDF